VLRRPAAAFVQKIRWAGWTNYVGPCSVAYGKQLKWASYAVVRSVETAIDERTQRTHDPTW